MSEEVRPIALFDAGVGGLSVLKHIIKFMPNEDIIYFSDSAHRPYSKNTDHLIKKYSYDIIKYFIKKNSKIIVIACNTITSSILPEAQKYAEIPIIGVIEAGVKEAVSKTKNNTVLVMGSRTTIKKQMYLRMLKKHSENIKVLELPCMPDLANIVEEGIIIPKYIIMNKLKSYFEPYLQEGFDTLILACTHFPFLIDYIREALNHKIEIVDPGRGTALRVMEILEKNKNIKPSKNKAIREFYTSGNLSEFKNFISKFFKIKDDNIKKIDLGVNYL